MQMSRELCLEPFSEEVTPNKAEGPLHFVQPHPWCHQTQAQASIPLRVLRMWRNKQNLEW